MSVRSPAPFRHKNGRLSPIIVIFAEQVTYQQNKKHIISYKKWEKSL